MPETSVREVYRTDELMDGDVVRPATATPMPELRNPWHTLDGDPVEGGCPGSLRLAFEDRRDPRYYAPTDLWERLPRPAPSALDRCITIGCTQRHLVVV
jgi:hypothetical protein